MSAYSADRFHVWMLSDDVFAGAAYQPFEGIWTVLPSLPGGEIAVGTGQSVFIWGWTRDASDFAALEFDPATQTLRDLPVSGLPATTGAVVNAIPDGLIVWGGAPELDDIGFPVGSVADGAILDAETGQWEPITSSPLTPRAYAHSVWTGDELLIWGGRGDTSTGGLVDGAAWDPGSGEWRVLPPAPGGSRPIDSTAVWTGDEMILWGGIGLSDGAAGPTGIAYSPSADSWRVTADAPGPARRGHAAVWTGTEMVVFGGAVEPDDAAAASDALLYDPATDTWRVVPGPAIERRFGPEYAWDGLELLIWGGDVWNGILGEYGGYEDNGYTFVP